VILEGSRGHAGIFVALAVAVLVYYWLWNTVSGYRLRAVGVNPKAARFGGVNVPRTLVLAIAVSGGLAGIGGMVELAGVRGYLLDNFSGGVGYTSIAVALLGGLHPAGVVAAALFVAALEAGAEVVQITTGVPSATVLVIEGLALVFVLGRRLVTQRFATD
jgi:simple sugar transport system permease protein